MWVDKLKARLVPVKYFHIVFTIPAAMHKLFYANQVICYDLLMRSASEAVLKAGENPASLGAKTGCVAVLHIYKTSWNVYAKPALNNAEKVIEYLGRYTHRVAISNARIVDIVNDKVLFKWKDYRHGGKIKIMNINGLEFISRFMMHVLPCGFYKIRYYGIFANKLCNDMLDTYLALNDKEMDLSSLEGKSWQEIVHETLGYDPYNCKRCKTGRMVLQINIDAEPRAA
jgi:hypothetical protein